MDTKITYIYGLTDGTIVRYVGKSDNPIKRRGEHIKESNINLKTHKHNWINKMKKLKKEVGIKILEITPHNNW
tara:strand:+ start:158 stop:376 length:219 start_codon:yes stop_codon:yes gene_type:complete